MEEPSTTEITDGELNDTDTTGAETHLHLGFQAEDTEKEKVVTLYGASAKLEYVPRKTEPKDVHTLMKFITGDTVRVFPDFDIGKLYEKSCFSLVLTEKDELTQLVAHASFTDIPTDPMINLDGKRWKNARGLEGVTALNTLFMSIAVFSKDASTDTCLLELVASTFKSCTPVDFIIIECPDLEYTGPFLFTKLATELVFSPKARTKKKLIIYAKDIMYPHMIVREGREHDLDDLIPLLTMDTVEIEQYFNKTYLSDLIAMSDRSNQSIVAEFDGEAVGMIAVTSDVNYNLLNGHFHLEPFHGLYKPHDDDEIHLQPISSHLLDRVKSSNIRVQDHFAKDGNPLFRKEQLSDIDLISVSTSGSSYTSSSSVDTFSDDDNAHDHDLFASLVKQQELTQQASKRTQETTLVDFIKSGKLAYTVRHHHASATEIHRKDGYLESIYARRKSVLPNAILDHASIDYTNELLKSDKEQNVLLEDITEIIKVLQDAGIDINTATLDKETIRVISDSEDMIHHCILSYLHRTLIDEKLLPMLDLNEPPESTFYGIPNAVAIQLVAMDKNFQIRILDLLEGAFLNFPNREYCILTTDSSVQELPWMKYFVRVIPKKNSLFPRSLYVIHKAMFRNKLNVRRATVSDLNNIVILIESLYESKKIMTDFETAVAGECNTKNMVCFVTEVVTHESVPIIGLVICSPERRSEKYQVNYDMDHYTYYDLHGENDHAYVHHFVISPLFQSYTKLVMKEVMRLMKKECLYHDIHPVYITDPKLVGNQTILNNMEDWIPLAPRRRIEYAMLNLTDIYDDQRQPPKYAQNYYNAHSVFHMAKKFTFEPKTAINTKIVFIGASETAIACLEKLTCRSNLDFKCITVISTHGLPGSLPHDDIRDMFFIRRNNPALSMRHDTEWHQRLGLRANVNVVYGTVIKIFRKMKLVIVNDRKVVPYDILVLTCGRQFIRPDCSHPEIQDENLNKFKETTSSKSAPIGHVKKIHGHKVLKRFTPKPKNVFLMNSELDAVQALNYLRNFTPYITKRQIIVHGACLEAYCCIRALLELGVETNRIIVVTTPEDEMTWENFHPYRDTAKLREIMNETLTQLGIQVISNYTFKRWNLEKHSGLCTRIYFASETEVNPRISISCFAYFSFTVRRIGDEIASALVNSFIAFNDGILINSKFETNDENIMAAGPAAVYEKKLCAEEFNHTHFCSYEVGRVLADFLLKKLIPPINEFRTNVVDPGRPSLPPLLTEPLVTYAELPGSWYYMYLRRPGYISSCCNDDCCCEYCECGTEIITGSTKSSENPEQKYFRLFLNSFQRVEAMECVSRVKFPPSCLSSLYGHHEAFLQKLLENLANEKVPDLYDYFCQPWISALCHDRWINFREEVQELFANYQIAPDIKISNFIRDYIDNLDNENCFKVDANIIRHIFDSTGLKTTLESKFLEFLKYNRSTLPMYARPDVVLDMYEERRASSLYLPQVKNFVNN